MDYDFLTLSPRRCRIPLSYVVDAAATPHCEHAPSFRCIQVTLELMESSYRVIVSVICLRYAFYIKGALVDV